MGDGRDGSAEMELLRTIAYPPGGGGASSTTAAARGCEAAVGRAGSAEPRRKKAEEQPHQHAHPAAEVSRIITDPTTGKRYCRGKVLGKVMAGPAPAALPGVSLRLSRPGPLSPVRRAAPPAPAGTARMCAVCASQPFGRELCAPPYLSWLSCPKEVTLID